jgi:thiol-disulfide isomerase/thioredoxin
MLGIWVFRLRTSHRHLALPTTQEQEAMLRARDLLRIRMSVQLRSSETAAEPALRGIWRPTVTIPRGLSEKLTPSEFEAVLLHELAHARRLDNLTGVLVHALVCVFWFHPLLWFIERRLRVERERACDELVIAAGMAPRIYAAGILKVCKFHLFEAAAGVSAMTGSDLGRRLELIHESRFSARLLYVPRLLVAGLAIFMTAVPIAGGYCEQCVSNGQGPIVRKSPELAFTIPGQGQKLLSEYRGKVVALEFILTTCPHCQAASTVMSRMQERFGKRGFQALDVAIDPNADLLVENFAKEYQAGFPVGWAPLEQMMTYMGFTERPVVPQLILVDRNGYIRYETPRLGDGESMKEDVIGTRIGELLAITGRGYSARRASTGFTEAARRAGM